MSLFNYTFLLGQDLRTKTRTLFRGRSDGGYTIREEQDVGDIAEANKAIYNMHDGVHFRGDNVTVARIPTQIYFDLWRRGIAQDDDALGRWIDDPDNKVWKIHPGRVRGTAKHLG